MLAVKPHYLSSNPQKAWGRRRKVTTESCQREREREGIMRNHSIFGVRGDRCFNNVVSVYVEGGNFFMTKSQRFTYNTRGHQLYYVVGKNLSC